MWIGTILTRSLASCLAVLLDVHLGSSAVLSHNQPLSAPDVPLKYGSRWRHDRSAS